jgi:hypothetical protein
MVDGRRLSSTRLFTQSSAEAEEQENRHSKNNRLSFRKVLGCALLSHWRDLRCVVAVLHELYIKQWSCIYRVSSQLLLLLMLLLYVEVLHCVACTTSTLARTSLQQPHTCTVLTSVLHAPQDTQLSVLPPVVLFQTPFTQSSVS